MAKKPSFDSPEGLSRKWASRYHCQLPRYQGRTLQLFSHISNGTNSYEAIIPRSDAVNNSKGADKDYARSLTAGLTLNVKADADKVMNVVCTIGSKYGRAPFKGNSILRQCLEELRKVFILKEVSEPGKDGKNHKVYIPVFALLAD